LFIYGCKSATDSNNSAYIEKFPKSIICSDKEILPISVLDPTSIIASDSLLVITQPKSDKVLKVYRREDFKHIADLLTKGRGPDEINILMKINQWDVSEGKMKLLVRSYPFFLAWIDVDKSLDSNKIVFTMRYDFASDYQKKMRIVESSFVFDLYANKLLIAKSELNLTETTDNPNPYIVFFDNTKGIVTDSVFMQNFVRTNNFSSLIYSGNVSISTDLKHFAKSYNYLNTVDFYDLITKTKKSVLLSREANQYVSALNNPNYYFTDSKSTKDFLFVLTAPRDSIKEGINRKIYTFRWDGTPVVELTFNENIWSFFVDQDSGELFAIDSERKIWRYRLNKDVFS
jgi:hypothetical protein